MSTLAACFKRGRRFTRIHHRCAALLGSEGGDLGFSCFRFIQFVITGFVILEQGSFVVVFGNEPVKVWGKT